jgi:hypothetical protein
LLLNSYFEYAIRRVQENQEGVKRNGIHQLLACVGDVNIMGGNIYITKKNREALLAASKVFGLEVNPETTKYTLLSRCKMGGQRRSIKIANSPFEDVAKLKYLETTLTDQNCMHEEINSRLDRGMLATIRFRVFCHPACCPGM